MANILVTGAAGYLGSVICPRLIEAGHRVTALDTMMYGQHSLFNLCHLAEFDFVFGDARDETTVRRLMADADVIIPLAAVVGAPACARDPWLATSVNRDAVGMIVRHASPSQLIVYPTTNSGYGTKSGEQMCTEETPLEPISLYGETKVQAENTVLEHPNAVTLRLATVFGMSPRMRLDLLVNHFVYAAVTDGFLVIFEKHFKRNFVHVRDVADTFVHAIENERRMKGQSYNVGLDEANLSKEELALKIRDYVPNFFIHFAEIGTDPDKRNYIVSNQKLRDAGMVATRSVDAGIQELLKGYRMMGRAHMKNV